MAAPIDRNELKEAVAETYTEEGVSLWWKAWEKAGPAHRRTMERSVYRGAV